jgi:hypothetical protein
MPFCYQYYLGHIFLLYALASSCRTPLSLLFLKLPIPSSVKRYRIFLPFFVVSSSRWEIPRAVLCCRVTFSRIVKTKSTEDFSGIPYNMTAAQLPLTNMVTNPLQTLDSRSCTLLHPWFPLCFKLSFLWATDARTTLVLSTSELLLQIASFFSEEAWWSYD